MPTLVLHPKGKLLSKWGQRDLVDLPVEEDVLLFIKNLRDFYMQNRDMMCFGNMVKPLPYKTEEVVYWNTEYGRSYIAQQVLTSAYELDGNRMQVFVNHNTEDKIIDFLGEPITVKALSVLKVTI